MYGTYIKIIDLFIDLCYDGVENTKIKFCSIQFCLAIVSLLYFGDKFDLSY